MAEEKQEQHQDVSEFAALLEQSLVQLREGEVVRGKVVAIVRDKAVVDVGYKSEGEVSLSEFPRGEDGKPAVEIGDEVEVLVEQLQDEQGVIWLSKEKADKMRVWSELEHVYNESDGVVWGKVVSRVKGGYTVDLGGVKAFMPGSQADIKPIKDMNSLVGQEGKFKILKLSKRRGSVNIVVSRRSVIEKEQEKRRRNLMENLREGAVLEGRVKNITDYGAFIDLGGIDGLLHKSDISWDREVQPTDVLVEGNDVEVKVLKVQKDDSGTLKVSLGLKQLEPDPWASVLDKYKEGDVVQGRVTKVLDYGIFVKLEPGIEGFVYVSEMSWTHKIKNPAKFFSVGDEIEAVVTEINQPERKISLSVRRTEPNPWDTVAEKYPPGTRLQSKIKNITEFGIFVGIDKGIDGLIHVSDISWSSRVKEPAELFQKGQEVEAVVKYIDKENQRFALSMKDLVPDPWLQVPEKYKVGDIVEGEVINITDFGLFIQLEEGVEGLIHVSELARDKVDDPREVAGVGDKVSAEIISIDPAERRIRLSIKSLRVREEKDAVSADDEVAPPPPSEPERLGDLVRKVVGEEIGKEGEKTESDSASDDGVSEPEPESSAEGEAEEAVEAEDGAEAEAETEPVEEGEAEEK